MKDDNGGATTWGCPWPCHSENCSWWRKVGASECGRHGVPHNKTDSVPGAKLFSMPPLPGVPVVVWDGETHSLHLSFITSTICSFPSHHIVNITLAVSLLFCGQWRFFVDYVIFTLVLLHLFLSYVVRMRLGRFLLTGTHRTLAQYYGTCGMVNW